MKRALWLALVLFGLVLASCGAPGGPSPTAQPSVEPSDTPPPVAVPTLMEVLPTPTPLAPPSTPTPVPVPSATPGRAGATAMPAKEAAEMPMIAIPAGEFVMGNDAGDDDEKPAHRVAVAAFEIDQLEVTNELFQVFVEDAGYVTEAEKAGESGTWRSYAANKPKHPVVMVTWNDAVAYCQWCAKRLPTEAEWEKAARGTEGFTYPWGNEWADGRANTQEAGLRGTTIVGSYPDGASPFGAMDMAGNVSEWTADWYEAYPGSTSQSAYFGKKYRVIRGGGWFSEEHLVRTTERSCSTVDLRNDDVGFRCVR